MSVLDQERKLHNNKSDERIEYSELLSFERNFSLNNVVSQLINSGIDLNTSIEAETVHFPNIRNDLVKMQDLPDQYETIYRKALGLISLFDYNPNVLTRTTTYVVDVEGNTYFEESQLVYSRGAEIRAIADLELEKRNQFRIILLDIAGMSKMPKDVGDVAINKLVKYLNDIIVGLGPKFSEYEIFLHRCGGDEFHVYIRTKDEHKYEAKKLDFVYLQLKKAITNKQFDPQNTDERTKYDLEIPTFVRQTTDPNSVVTREIVQGSQLQIRMEDVYIPSPDDQFPKIQYDIGEQISLTNLLWQLSVFRGLYPSQKEVAKQAAQINALQGEDKENKIAALVKKHKDIKKQYQPFQDTSENNTPEQNSIIQKENATKIQDSIIELSQSYPFLKPIFNECFELDKQTFGVDENGLLNDSIITKRLISSIIRTGIDPLLGTIDFPSSFIDLLRENGYIQSTMVVETRLKAINDEDHTVGDQIIIGASKKLFQTIFSRYYQINKAERDRVGDLNKNPDSLPAQYIPVEFRKFLLFHRTGTKLFLELTNAQPENDEEKRNLRNLEVYFKLVNKIPLELETQEEINIYALDREQQTPALIKVPIVYHEDVNIPSSAVIVDPAIATTELIRYGFLRPTDSYLTIGIDEKELADRYADLSYQVNLVKEFLKLDITKLERYLDDMIKGEISGNHEQFLTDGTQRFFLKTWINPDKGPKYCDSYLKVLNTQISENSSKIATKQLSNNPKDKQEIQTLSLLNDKLRLLKRFFILIRNLLAQNKTNLQQVDYKLDILQQYRGKKFRSKS